MGWCKPAPGQLCEAFQFLIILGSFPFLAGLYSEGLSTDPTPVFLLQVKVGNHAAEGSGTNKKVAKRNAAENMLEILGFKVPQSQPSKPALKSEEKVRPRALSPCFHCKMPFSPPGALWLPWG